MTSIRFSALGALLFLVLALGVARGATAAAAPVNLSVTDDDGATRVIASRDVEYVLTVANAGPGVAAGARVYDLPPPELEAVVWRCIAHGGASCAQGASISSLDGTGAVDQEIYLPPGGSLVFKLGGTLSPLARGYLLNWVRVSAPTGVVDPKPADNTASDLDQVLRPFVLSKEVSGSFVPGGEVLYTITITNDTSVLQPDNDTPEFEDDLPGELVATGASASSGTVDLDLVSHRIRWNGSIPPGGTVVLMVEATIRNGTDGAEVVNQGELHFALSLDPSTDTLGSGATNDGLAFTEDPRTSGPTSFQVLVLSVPALETSGLLLLALLLGLGATAVLGRP